MNISNIIKKPFSSDTLQFCYPSKSFPLPVQQLIMQIALVQLVVFVGLFVLMRSIHCYIIKRLHKENVLQSLLLRTVNLIFRFFTGVLDAVGISAIEKLPVTKNDLNQKISTIEKCLQTASLFLDAFNNYKEMKKRESDGSCTPLMKEDTNSPGSFSQAQESPMPIRPTEEFPCVYNDGLRSCSQQSNTKVDIIEMEGWRLFTMTRNGIIQDGRGEITSPTQEIFHASFDNDNLCLVFFEKEGCCVGFVDNKITSINLKYLHTTLTVLVQNGKMENKVKIEWVEAYSHDYIISEN